MKGLQNPNDIFQLAGAMRKSDPERVFREVCKRTGVDAEEAIDRAQQMASMFGMR